MTTCNIRQDQTSNGKPTTYKTRQAKTRQYNTNQAKTIQDTINEYNTSQDHAHKTIYDNTRQY